MHAAAGKSRPVRFMVRQIHPFSVEAIPVAGAAGDQQAALFGQACFRER